MEGGNNIATIRKANVFSEAVSQKEQDIIEQRVKQQQKQLQFFEDRDKQQKYTWIKRMHPYITMEEALEAISLSDGDEVRISRCLVTHKWYSLYCRMMQHSD